MSKLHLMQNANKILNKFGYNLSKNPIYPNMSLYVEVVK